MTGTHWRWTDPAYWRAVFYAAEHRVFWGQITNYRVGREAYRRG